MKRKLFLLLCALPLTGWAQTRKFEHTLFGGVGLQMNKHSYLGDKSLETGICGRLGYGLNCYLTPNLSIMPGANLRFTLEQSEQKGSSLDSGPGRGLTFADLPVLLQYHVRGRRGGLVVGLGPVFSFCLDNTRSVSTDESPFTNPNRRVVRRFNLALQPSLLYEQGHFRYGIEAYVGLLKVDDFCPDTRMYDLSAVLHYRF